jgi:hypothetical protein
LSDGGHQASDLCVLTEHHARRPIVVAELFVDGKEYLFLCFDVTLEAPSKAAEELFGPGRLTPANERLHVVQDRVYFAMVALEAGAHRDVGLANHRVAVACTAELVILRYNA